MTAGPSFKQKNTFSLKTIQINSYFFICVGVFFVYIYMYLFQKSIINQNVLLT